MHDNTRWMAAVGEWRDYGEPPPSPRSVAIACGMAVAAHHLAVAIVEAAAPEDRLRAKCVGEPVALALALEVLEAGQRPRDDAR